MIVSNAKKLSSLTKKTDVAIAGDKVVRLKLNNVIYDTSKAGYLAALETAVLAEEQADAPVVHSFGPGVYIREVSAAKNTFAIGHHQRYEHLNIVLKGHVKVITEDGTLRDIIAPAMFTGKPGKKIGFVVEDMVWLNVYATDETDISKLEEYFLVKTDEWRELEELELEKARLLESVNREDYRHVLEEFGISEETALAETHQIEDMIGLPKSSYKIKVDQSPISGKGLFATANIAAGDIIAPAKINGKRTIAGRYTNHSIKPNAEILLLENGDSLLIANRDIRGCTGGKNGEEITINYRVPLQTNGRKALCQAS
jgi:hypothetical protein